MKGRAVVFAVLWLAMNGCGPHGGSVASNGKGGPTDGPTSPRVHAPTNNAISRENARGGNSEWRLTKPANAGEIEGYALRESVAAGDTLALAVSVKAPAKFSWNVYRMGYYGGAGARELSRGGLLSATPQPPCATVKNTGLVACGWKPSLTLQTTLDWPRGVYLVKLTREDGYQRYVPFVVRDDTSKAAVLVVLPTGTWQAYNTYQGESLYDDPQNITGVGRAFQVSFDRPYTRDFGAGHFLRSDQSLVNWLEAQGVDVGYVTDADLDRTPEAMGQGGAVVLSGHDEYWSHTMRAGADAAVASGTSLLLLGANTAYWQIRFEPAADGRDRRIITCYKQSAPKLDPVGPASPLLTVGFRTPPVSHPESLLFGVMFQGTWNQFSFPAVIVNPDHWALDGTGLSQGDSLWQAAGYEMDALDSASGLQPEILADSPALGLQRPFGRGQMVIRQQGDAWVFAAGGVDFVDLLSHPAHADGRAARIVANILYRAVGAPVPSQLVTFSPPPAAPAQGPFARNVQTVAGVAGNPGQQDGAAGIGQLSAPIAVSPLPNGSLAVLDAGLKKVRVVDASGAISTLPLTGLDTPMGLAADSAGNIYVSDSNNALVRAIHPDGSSAVVADNSNAHFAAPSGLAISPDGALLVADVGAGSIRRVDLRTHEVSTVAGASGLYRPSGVAALSDGSLVVVETGNCRVLRIAQGHLQVLAGGNGCGFADGVASQAKFLPQLGIAALSDGSVVVSDPGNNRIRRISNGLVSSFAGSGNSGHRDGSGDQADFSLPAGLAVRNSVVYVADAGNGAIRAIAP